MAKMFNYYIDIISASECSIAPKGISWCNASANEKKERERGLHSNSVKVYFAQQQQQLKQQQQQCNGRIEH